MVNRNMAAFVFLETYLASSKTTGWSLGSVNWERLMEEADGIAAWHGSGAVDDVSDDEQLARLKEESYHKG